MNTTFEAREQRRYAEWLRSRPNRHAGRDAWQGWPTLRYFCRRERIDRFKREMAERRAARRPPRPMRNPPRYDAVFCEGAAWLDGPPIVNTSSDEVGRMEEQHMLDAERYITAAHEAETQCVEAKRELRSVEGKIARLEAQTAMFRKLSRESAQRSSLERDVALLVEQSKRRRDGEGESNG